MGDWKCGWFTFIAILSPGHLGGRKLIHKFKFYRIKFKIIWHCYNVYTGDDWEMFACNVLEGRCVPGVWLPRIAR